MFSKAICEKVNQDECTIIHSIEGIDKIIFVILWIQLILNQQKNKIFSHNYKPTMKYQLKLSLLIINFFSLFMHVIFQHLKGEAMYSPILFFDILATIFLNALSISLQNLEYKHQGGSTLLFKLRFMMCAFFDTLCILMSVRIIMDHELEHSWRVVVGYVLQMVLQIAIIGITNDNNLGSEQYQKISDIEVQIKNQEDQEDTLRDLLDHSWVDNDLNSTRLSISAEKSEFFDIRPHVDLLETSRSKMKIRLNQKQVHVQDVQVTGWEVKGEQKNTVVYQDINVNQVTEEGMFCSEVVQRRWTDVMIMLQELQAFLEPAAFHTLPKIEDVMVCRQDQLCEASIKERLSALNSLFKELTMVDTNPEGVSNFFSSEYSGWASEEFDRHSFHQSRRYVAKDTDEFGSEHATDDEAYSQEDLNQSSDSLKAMESLDVHYSPINVQSSAANFSISNSLFNPTSSTAHNEVNLSDFLADKPKEENIPIELLSKELKISAKYKIKSDPKHYIIKVQVSVCQWKSEMRKTFKEVFALQQFLKQQLDIQYTLSNEQEVKHNFRIVHPEYLGVLNDNDREDIYEELRNEYEDFLKWMVKREDVLQLKRVRNFLELPTDINDLTI